MVTISLRSREANYPQINHSHVLLEQSRIADNMDRGTVDIIQDIRSYHLSCKRHCRIRSNSQYCLPCILHHIHDKCIIHSQTTPHTQHPGKAWRGFCCWRAAKYLPSSGARLRDCPVQWPSLASHAPRVLLEIVPIRAAHGFRCSVRVLETCSAMETPSLSGRLKHT